jgi:hypothetical protein
MSLIVEIIREAIKSSKEAHLQISRSFPITNSVPAALDFKNRVYSAENFAY